MKQTASPEERQVIQHAVERQFLWRDLLRRLDREIQAEREAEQLKPLLGPYITVSRQAGAGGGEIAARVGKELGWNVLDKEIIEMMAERFQMDPEILGIFDETKSNWIREVLGSLLDHRLVSQDAYVTHLGRMILLAAYQGNVVLVGRGAQFMLPRHRGLAVRVVADERDRLDHIAQRSQLPAKEARALMMKIDRGREEFARRYFHREISDPGLYDMVVNSSTFGIEQGTQLIVTAYRLRGFEERPTPAG